MDPRKHVNAFQPSKSIGFLIVCVTCRNIRQGHGKILGRSSHFHPCLRLVREKVVNLVEIYLIYKVCFVLIMSQIHL